MSIPRSFALALIALSLIAGCDTQSTQQLLARPELVTPSPNDGSLAEKFPKCHIIENDEEHADQVLRLINIERFDWGVVTIDPELTKLAADTACEMIDDGYFGHRHPLTGDSIVERAANADYDYLTIGENLAAGFERPSEIVHAWMQSETHRDVMLDPVFTKAGIAIRHGGEYGVYCVLLLAGSDR
jgi:uncharacterized protein YkwD